MRTSNLLIWWDLLLFWQSQNPKFTKGWNWGSICGKEETGVGNNWEKWADGTLARVNPSPDTEARQNPMVQEIEYTIKRNKNKQTNK